jgi:hypothetical protein
MLAFLALGLAALGLNESVQVATDVSWSDIPLLEARFHLIEARLHVRHSHAFRLKGFDCQNRGFVTILAKPAHAREFSRISSMTPVLKAKHVARGDQVTKRDSHGMQKSLDLY